MRLIFGLGMLLVGLASDAVVLAESLRDCDQQTAHPFDLQKPTGVAGVEFAAIDATRAVESCEAAVKEYSSEPRLAFELGRAYDKSHRDGDAADWYRKAAERNYGIAQFSLGRMYEVGQGIPQDFHMAVTWYRKAAGQKLAAAQNALGNLSENGLGVTQDYAEAVIWYRRAAEQNYPAGQFNLGHMYELGHGVAQDYGEAARWYRKGAEQEHAASQHKLARLYEQGLGVKADYSAALQWYRKAAEKNFGPANYQIGLLHEKGLGVPADPDKAVEWYRRAAALGSREAEQRLARLAEEDRDLPSNDVKASKEDAHAAPADYPTATKVFTELAIDQKIAITVGLIATGDFKGLYDGSYSKSLHSAIEAFQSRQNLPVTGVLLPEHLASLKKSAARFFQPLGLRSYKIGDTGPELLVPRALFDTETRRKEGYSFERNDSSISMSYETIANSSLEDLFRRLTSASGGRVITYHILRRDYLVTSGEFKGRNFYSFFNRTSAGPTGFTFSWTGKHQDVASRITIFLANSSRSEFVTPELDFNSHALPFTIWSDSDRALCALALNADWKAWGGWQQAVAEASRRKLSIDDCRVALGLPKLSPFASYNNDNLCRIALETDRTAWEDWTKLREAVAEAKRRKLSIDDCRIALGLPKRSIFFAHSDRALCIAALDNEKTQWDRRGVSQQAAAEAARRKLSVDDCRVALGLSKLPLFGAHTAPEERKQIYDRILGEIVQPSPFGLHNDRALCGVALNFEKTAWDDRGPWWLQEAVAEATRRKFSVDDCRVALGLPKRTVFFAHNDTALCGLALKNDRTAWEEGAKWRAAVAEATQRKLSVDACRVVLGLSKLPRFGSYNDGALCGLALKNDRTAWDEGAKWREAVAEATRRHFSIDDCRTAIGLTKITAFGAHTDKNLCGLALDSDRTGWETRPGWEKAGAEAIRRKLSIDDCRTIQGLPERTPLDLAVASDPMNAKVYFDRGLAYVEAGNHDQAIADFHRAIALDPNNDKTLSARGDAYERKGEHDRAMTDFHRAITINANNVAALSARGNNYYKNSDYDRAIADFDRIIALNPQSLEAFDRRILAYFWKGDYDRAIVELDRALDVRPEFVAAAPSSVNILAVVGGVGNIGRGDYDAAIKYLDRAVALHPDDYFVYVYRGLAHTEMDDFDRAIADFDRAVSLRKEYPMAYAFRAYAHAAKGNPQQAFADVERALALDSTSGYAMIARGFAYLLQDNYQRGNSDLDYALQSFEPETYAELRPIAEQIIRLRRAAIYLQVGDPERALADLNEAVRRAPKRAENYRRRAEAYLKVGKLDLSRVDIARALELRPASDRVLQTFRDLQAAEGTPKLGKRVALVVGNSAYEHVPELANPRNDAVALERTLKAIGFDEVQLLKNLDQHALLRALMEFSNLAAGAETAAVYYAGHGVEVDRHNYLVPTDAKLLRATDVEFEAVPLDIVRTAVSRAKKLRLVILDACRNNPFKLASTVGKRNVGRGLARVEPGSNELIAYAAKEGTLADDGTGQANSPYAAALIKHLAEPGLEIRLLFGRVRDEVMETTGKEQEPFMYGSLGGEAIYLNPPRAQTIDASPKPPLSEEARIWPSIEKTESCGILGDFIRRFEPGGSVFVDFARTRQKELRCGDATP